MATMAGEYRDLVHELGKASKPEYNLALINENLDSLPDPLGAVLRVVQARKKREADEQQRREANRKLQEQLARRHDELAQQDREEAESERLQDGNPRVEAPEGVKEPEVSEPLCLSPPQPTPAVDLAPLGLPPSLSHSETMALLNELIVTRQLFAHAGAFDGASASPILKMLFSIVAYGEDPHSASQQLVRYYSAADVPDMGWVPQLPDFFTALTMLGYQPPRGHGGGGGGGSRKRSAVYEGPSPQAGGAGGSGSDRDGRGRWPFAQLLNLQGLLRLLADLSRLQLRGRVDAGFGSHGEASCKGLITALLRMLLDTDLSSRLHADVCAALEGLMQPWDEPRWRRICDDTAATAADLGPSHRAAYRVISDVQGLSKRLRTWQQCAALQLLRKTLPQDMVGSAGGSGGSHRGQLHMDIRQVQAMLGKDCPKGVKALLNGLGRSLRDRGSSGAAGAAAAGGGVDYWRLLTVLQCTHLVVWTTVYVAEGEEDDDMIRWILTYFKIVEQSMRGQQATVMRIKVFLADVQTNYEVLAGVD